MDRPRYIEYILVLKTFFQINDYPLEIIQIIIMSIYRDIDIGCGSNSSHLFIYDRMCPKLICYALENNESGIGHGSEVTTKSFQRLRFEEPIKSIVCGRSYSVCLTEKGNVYSWGNNKSGQLGLADNISKCSPQKIKLSNISIINCGYGHTISYGNGILYGWGSNYSHQLGLGNRNDKNEPTKVSLFKKDILQISCGSHHTMCLDHDYNMIGWGNNLHGQLCMNDYTIGSYSTPREITFFKERNIKIISVKCGSGHTIVLTTLNEIYVCGSNSDYQLGLFFGSSFFMPKKVYPKVGDKSNEIECGDHCSVIVTASKKIYMSGLTNPYKHGPSFDQFTICQEFKNISNIKKVRCGLGRVFVTTDDNIYVWVSGEQMRKYPIEFFL